uniref:Ig-like domain-containing protein n=1 Tax=Cyprinus carpio carpio TaxID=630221 RepID=A0A9J7YNV8_CYPCA
MMDLQNVIIPLLLSYTTVFTVLHGQKVVTDLKVTGYQGHDVTLLCQYINGNTEDKILQMQWTWQNESSKYEIMVFSTDHGLSLQDTFLKDRVSFRKSSPPIYEASIIIKDVKMSDQGVYSCAYTTFPSGSHTGQTTLTVLEDSPPVLSTAEAVRIVTAVMLITMILTVVGYLFLRNRRRAGSNFTYYTPLGLWFHSSSVKPCIMMLFDQCFTSLLDTTQSPSDLQDVTYSDVTILKPGKANRSTSSSGDIEYSAVSFSGRSGSASLRASANQTALGFHTAEQESVYAQVKKD